ncbi:unnamed protein product [Caenorhabditis angaria]|uniref:Mitochondrial import receptor subunit TOM70 n=1 Tax=Caenorhabditis angaria TaxID=860376 RepID=A0A9P1IGX9_9PELO|nr:unnamed protein product [Caenorhabditis angaria]
MDINFGSNTVWEVLSVRVLNEESENRPENPAENMVGANGNGLSDGTRRLLMGAAVAGVTAGLGYLAFQRLTREERISLKQCLENIKNEGNDYFKNRNYQNALLKFTEGITIGEENEGQENGLVAMLYQNRAACREKIGNETAYDILKDCLAAIRNDKGYAKAYLRASKQLNLIGKKTDALIYLLGAFALDPNLNKLNFQFYEELLTIDFRQTIMPQVPRLFERKPAPVALYRIQQWLDTWDYVDLFKKDIQYFIPNAENEEELLYRKALDQIKNGEYEQVLETLESEDLVFAPAQILRGKFLNYSIQPSRAIEYADNFGTITTLEEYENDLERHELIMEAFQILKMELCLTFTELEEFMNDVAPESKRFRRNRYASFAAINVYNGCVLDTSATTHEEQMIADTKNAAKMMEIAAAMGPITPHVKMMKNFVELCSTNDYSIIHNTIREMEDMAQNRPTHFILIMMAKVYLMTGNIQSAKQLMDQAEQCSNTRYLKAGVYLQSADLHLNKPNEERAIEVSRCAQSALEFDEFNCSAHILLLLGTNGPDPVMKRDVFEKSQHHISHAALFAPPRELMMLKRMWPLIDAKKRAAELVGQY